MSVRQLQGILLALLIGCGGSAAAAGGAVGEVILLQGSASRTGSDGGAHALERGHKVYEQDRIETGAGSLLSLEFHDHTRFNLGPQSVFSVDQVRDGDADAAFSAEVVKGAFRFVTGLIAKRRARAMQIRTGVVATIGIRGTTVGGEVEGESATIVLLASEDAGTPSAIEVGNEHGSVVIDQAGFGTRVPDRASPPTPPARMSLRAIENLVRNINNIQRIAVPRPVLR